MVMDLKTPLLVNPNETHNITSYSNASLLSLLTFSWLNSLLKHGNKTCLKLDHVPSLFGKDTALHSDLTFQSNLSKLRANSPLCSTGLAKAIFLSIWEEWSVNALFALAYTISSFVGPYLISPLMEYLEGKQEQVFGYGGGYMLASVFIGTKVIESFTKPYRFFGSHRLSLQIRSALTAAIYKKGLRLSYAARQRHSSGEIINYASTDVDTIGDFAWFGHDICLLPVQILLALFILYRNLGIASLAGLAATIALALANQPFAGLQKKFQYKIMEAKDERMKITSEALRTMQILKLYAWETKYMQRLLDMRKNECGWLWKYLYARAIVKCVFWATPILVSAATFCICVFVGVNLTTGKVLVTLATLKVLQRPIQLLPDLVSALAKAKVSLDRIANFLEMEELQCTAVERTEMRPSGAIIDIEGGEFSWDPFSPASNLSVIRLQVKAGMKVAICGPVGSGKSNILSCILGEMTKISGEVKVRGRTAYVSQSPWIQSATTQENILFGKAMNEMKYKEVIKACALEKDLQLFSQEDQTQIGERGINLSGGQKQRIQLARAIYQDAHIYLLDDPFSAVDADTGTHLFKECIQGILRSKTILYVTHQVGFLPPADPILVMRDGMVTQAGKYNNLLQEGMDFIRMVGSHDQALEAVNALKIKSSFKSSGHEQMSEHTSKRQITSQNSCKATSTLNIQDAVQDIEKNSRENGAEDPRLKKEQIVQDEEKQQGRVSFQIYCSYLTAVYKGLLVIVILLAHVFFQILEISSNYWMASESPTSIDDKQIIDSSLLILVYILLAVGSVFCALVRSVVLSKAALQTAQMYFVRMLTCIFHAPMAFFDATPTGRILNRVSTDQTEVFAISILVLAIIVWYQRYYIETARELARLVGVQKAPIINHFAESISGASTIRAFDQEGHFINTNLTLLDDYSRVRFHSSASQEWLGLRMNLLSNFIFSSCLLFLLNFPKGAVDPSVAGLAVTYGLNLTALQFLVIYNLCYVENTIISVERILQYCKIPSEAPLLIEENRPNCDWPSNGTVDFDNLHVRYGAHLPIILKGITCSFPGGKEVGIVGRTGSGKSTLIQALFRIVEPAWGKIMIDGLDITKVGLHDLRSRISIIPQEPVMFEGSIRVNLDPLEEHSDTEIWEALRKCQLKRAVHAEEGKLNSKAVSENGENWSMGQRQLMCLGRVLLKKNRILVLDEATASIDTETDFLIHETVRREYAECTVITIAHRIFTVMDSDLVLVLNEGRIVEYDSPSQLLQQSSFFMKLVERYTGRSSDTSDMS
ncbi:hypothetical protein SUGI_0981600 [Cryptomeria japonica]|nr:hypothetical protein SUGI_0981600 [Cryptomeria japonica]